MVPLLLAVVLFPDTSTRILAQTATDAGPWLTALNLGLAGIGLWMFATGRLVAQSTFHRCEEKLAAAEAELRRRADEDRSTLIPALVRSTDILARHLDRVTNTPPPPHKGDRR